MTRLRCCVPFRAPRSQCSFPWIVFGLLLLSFVIGFATSGSVEIGGLGMFEYNYEVLKDTYNERSLQGFSTKAQEKMYACDTGCPYSIYMKFYNYYGVFDYGNQWILAALNKTQTSFKNGNADFSGYGMAGLAGEFSTPCGVSHYFPRSHFRVPHESCSLSHSVIPRNK